MAPAAVFGSIDANANAAIERLANARKFPLSRCSQVDKHFASIVAPSRVLPNDTLIGGLAPLVEDSPGIHNREGRSVSGTSQAMIHCGQIIEGTIPWRKANAVA